MIRKDGNSAERDLRNALKEIWPFVRRPPLTSEQQAFDRALKEVRRLLPELSDDT